MSASARALLEDLYRAAVAAVEPGAIVRHALEQLSFDPGGRLFILAIGKASPGMAAEALEFAHARGRPLVGGLVIAPEMEGGSISPLDYLPGDHPIPSTRSLEAAHRLVTVASTVHAEDEVWVLLSGGTSSLIAAPIDGVLPQALITLYQLLLGSGLDITRMNQVRKRFSRWGAGRLAQALAPARIHLFAISDVIGDDLADIGSGPLSPDPSFAVDIRHLLDTTALRENLPPGIREYLSQVESGTRAETPKPGDPVFRRVAPQVIATNRTALDAVARRSRDLDLQCEIMEPLEGEAAEAGTALAQRLIATEKPDVSRCLVWGGETTVTLGKAPGRGGRCQELALAAAIEMAHNKSRGRITLLAAGTDGRDGPTDAAGSVVDGQTFSRIAASGRIPTDHLTRHDAYPALDAAGALFKTGPTGTNVMDIVIALVENR